MNRYGKKNDVTFSVKTFDINDQRSVLGKGTAYVGRLRLVVYAGDCYGDVAGAGTVGKAESIISHVLQRKGQSLRCRQSINGVCVYAEDTLSGQRQRNRQVERIGNNLKSCERQDVTIRIGGQTGQGGCCDASIFGELKATWGCYGCVIVANDRDGDGCGACCPVSIGNRVNERISSGFAWRKTAKLTGRVIGNRIAAASN